MTTDTIPAHFVCQIGNQLPPDYFCPPSSESHGDVLDVIAFLPSYYAGRAVDEADWLYFHRIRKGASWIRVEERPDPS